MAATSDRASSTGGLSESVLHTRLRQMLDGFRTASARDPFGNPILRATLEITRLEDSGELDREAISGLVQEITAQAFTTRAKRLHAYAGETDPVANEATLRNVIEGLVHPEANAPPIAFETFRSIVETIHYGVVFTAHPTFSLSLALARTLVALATGRNGEGGVLTPEARAALFAEVHAADHRPPPITLEEEFALAMEALNHAHDALTRVHRVVLDVARTHYPDQWRALEPRLVSLASWVGYDHDGRSDIGWTDTLATRLKEKRLQLRAVLRTIDALRVKHRDAASAPALLRAHSMLSDAVGTVEEQLSAAAAESPSVAQAAAFARTLVTGRTRALTEVNHVIALFDEAIAAAEDELLASELILLRASLAGSGFARGHTHFRLNAAQLHNAVRHQIELEGTPNDPSRRRSYLNAINVLLDNVTPVRVNIGSLLAEKASARRMFIMIAELAKHVDSCSPVRFLIAETESGFTLLVALYLARRFGVDHLVEISPLFETEAAMEHGERVIEEALRSAHYRAYISRLGRLCVQFGFSDSGRYIGQMAAAYRIERLRIRLAQLLARHGLKGIQVVMFNTHGEAIGRGGHPVSLVDRLRYLAPPVSRAIFAEAGIQVKEESSFQGIEGYLLFLSPAMAFATLCRILEFSLGNVSACRHDPIYEDTDFGTEFFASSLQEFSKLVEDPGYAALLGAYGTNLLDRTGSRPVHREYESGLTPARMTHPSQLRAIPNNAVLHQLGFLANTLTGLGNATAKDPERFRLMLRDSPRFRRAMAMVSYAASLSDLDVLGAYVGSWDPEMWLNRSGRTANPMRRDELRAIAAQLERTGLHMDLAKTFRRLKADYLLLENNFTVAQAKSPLAKAMLPETARSNLALLHAIRIALIHRVYLLTTHIPDFTPYRGMTRTDLFQRLLRLDIEDTPVLFEEIFPRRKDAEIAAHDFVEPADYPKADQTYEIEHTRIFVPIAECFALIRRISAAITHYMGAIG